MKREIDWIEGDSGLGIEQVPGGISREGWDDIEGFGGLRCGDGGTKI